MRKFITSLLFILILLSCRNIQNKQTGITEKDSIDSLSLQSSFEDFPVHDTVKGEEIYMDAVLDFARIKISDDKLFISCFSCDTMVYVYSLPEMKLLNSFGMKGQGPDDFFAPVFCSALNGVVGMWGYADFRTVKLFDVDNSGLWKLKQQFKLVDNEAYNQSYVILDSFLIYNMIPLKLGIEKINLYQPDQKKQYLYSMDEDKNKYGSFYMQNKGDVAGSNKGIAYLYAYIDRIDFFDTDFNLQKIRFNEKNRMHIVPLNANQSMTYYQCEYAGANYLYALRIASVLQSFYDSPHGKIEVFDWFGNPIIQYSLEPIPNIFAVDEKNGCIYGHRYQNEDVIFRYNIGKH